MANFGLGNKSRGRVLIVEDEALIAMMLEDTITEFGYEVAGTACSVDTALAQIEARSPDVVLLDLFFMITFPAMWRTSWSTSAFPL